MSECNLKNIVCLNFLAFSSFYHQKCEKAYFEQPLECAAPECLSKYTKKLYIILLLAIETQILCKIEIDGLCCHFGANGSLHFTASRDHIEAMLFRVKMCFKMS